MVVRNAEMTHSRAAALIAMLARLTQEIDETRKSLDYHIEHNVLPADPSDARMVEFVRAINISNNLRYVQTHLEKALSAAAGEWPFDAHKEDANG